jgi:hypothetical protein
MTTIEEFLAKEELKMNWVDKLIHSYPKVQSTKGYGGSLKTSDLKPERIIKPTRWTKITSTLILIPPVAMWYMFLSMIITQPELLPICIFFLVFSTFIVFLAVKNSIFNKEYFYNIKLTNSGITLGRNRFFWEQIEETCILNRREGKVWVSYLIILGRDNSTERYSLFKFNIADSKLAALIEYYKHRLNN